VTLAFGAGTAVTGDVYRVPTSGNPSLQSGTGTLIPTVSPRAPSTPTRAVVTISTAAPSARRLFTYSLDGGLTVSAPALIPAGGSFVVPDAGLVLTFSGTFVAADTYSFTTTTASYNTTDLTNAWNALVGDPRQWFMAHVVGAASSVANAATLATALDDARRSASSNFRFVRVLMEVPSDTDANTLSAFASTTTRVSWCAGYHTTTSPLNGRDFSRNSAWSVAARVAAIPPAEDPGRVASGRAARRAVARARRVQDAGPRQRPLHDR
jgi:hypothetical protein